MIRFIISYIGGIYKIKLGFCPVCNSDAPEVYDCAICDGYQQANGDKYPPSLEVKQKWRIDYIKVITAMLITREQISINEYEL